MRRPVLLALALGLVLGLLPGGPASADAVESRPWRGLDVPYLSGGKLHFRGGSVRIGVEVPATITATRGSAIVQPVEPEIWELAARGRRLRVLAHDAVGLPMTDPVGDWVFWTAARGRRVRLMGFDTDRHRERRGPLLPRDGRVWAVEGDTVYAGDLDRRLTQWRPGSDPVAVPVAAVSGGLITDVDQGRTVVNVERGDSGDVEVRGPDGTVLARVSDEVADTFDPSGRYLATRRGWWDSATGVTTRPDLGRWTPVSTRWAPSGELVVVAQVERPERYEHSAARRFVCSPATGACDRLPDPRGVRRYRIGQEPYPSSALAQLGSLLGS